MIQQRNLPTPDINEILARPENKGCSEYGADMGRMSQTAGVPERLYLQRLRWVDGDYDTGGAYWGGPVNSDPRTYIWCAFSPDDTPNDPPIRVFARAASRDVAKTKVLEALAEDGFTFFDDFAAAEMLQGYVKAALWIVDDENGDPLERNYQFDDLHPDAITSMAADCEAFADAVVESIPFVLSESDPDDLGSDFWLTRQGTGCGFRDGDWQHLDRDGIDVGERLYEISKRFKETNLYVGDDGMIHEGF